MDFINFLKQKVSAVATPKKSTIICSDCETSLINFRSMEAGMGPICLSRTRFIETVPQEKLSVFEGKKKLLIHSHEFKTGLLREKDGKELKYVTLLKKEDDTAVYIDRSKYNELYNSGKSVTDSIMLSLEETKFDEASTISSISEPKTGELNEQFNQFVERYKEELKTREKDFSEFGFLSISSKSLMTEDQKALRKEFVKNYKTKNIDEDFKQKWSSGHYSIATLLSRLESSKIDGAKDLAKSIKKKHPDVKPQDYGLTDDELILGFQQATLPLEKKIFSAILKGENRLKEIGQKYSNLTDSSSPENYYEFHALTT